MKYAYCPSCDRVSVLATLEPERCQQCGKAASRVPVERTWHYWASAGAILAGAAAVFLTNLPEILQRLALLGPFLVIGIGFSSWGLQISKKIALERGRSHREGTG